jgi:hypothetical protein
VNNELFYVLVKKEFELEIKVLLLGYLNMLGFDIAGLEVLGYVGWKDSW